MCARTARKHAAAAAEQHEGLPQADIVNINEGQQGAAPAAETHEEEPIAPPRINGEVQQCVDSAASTITGCSESEMKNYLATADFVARQVSLQMANLWKQICRTAEANGKDGKASKVGLSVKIDIDQSNLLLMDTKIKMGFAHKYSESVDTQEDLRQIEFSLKSG